jgi:hypothetical protein
MGAFHCGIASVFMEGDQHHEGESYTKPFCSLYKSFTFQLYHTDNKSIIGEIR